VTCDTFAAESGCQRVPKKVRQRSATLRGNGKKTAYVFVVFLVGR